MPELPEVETTRAGLVQHLHRQTIEKASFRTKTLRYPLKRAWLTRLPGKTIVDITRRSKYLLFHFAEGGLLWHLGMSGSMRLCTHEQPYLKHDHIELRFTNGCLLRYHDPRRFGCLLLVEDFATHPLLKIIGPEPLGRHFNRHYLKKLMSRKKCSVKQLLMDQKVVAGVGNIYANEILFLAGLHPESIALCCDDQQIADVVKYTKQVLRRAIRCGGSTLRDFVNPGGQPGYFQQTLWVYGRAGEKCRRCHTEISSLLQNGRSSFCCTKCQTMIE